MQTTKELIEQILLLAAQLQQDVAFNHHPIALPTKALAAGRAERIAGRLGVSRETIHKALHASGNSSFPEKPCGTAISAAG